MEPLGESPIDRYYSKYHNRVFVDFKDKVDGFKNKLTEMIEKAISAKVWAN